MVLTDERQRPFFAHATRWYAPAFVERGVVAIQGLTCVLRRSFTSWRSARRSRDSSSRAGTRAPSLNAKLWPAVTPRGGPSSDDFIVFAGAPAGTSSGRAMSA